MAVRRAGGPGRAYRKRGKTTSGRNGSPRRVATRGSKNSVTIKIYSLWVCRSCQSRAKKEQKEELLVGITDGVGLIVRGRKLTFLTAIWLVFARPPDTARCRIISLSPLSYSSPVVFPVFCPFTVLRFFVLCLL